jgi:hypothetical protein
MAELSAAETTSDSCCSPEQRATCCEPSEKRDCCAPDSSSCGCSAGQTSDDVDLREQVRERYATAARAAGADETGGGCTVGLTDEHGRQVFGGSLYKQQDAGDAQHALAVQMREAITYVGAT